MPKISVCIPAYNQVVYLKRTIDSVLTQTYRDFEIIITDDSSTDIVKELVLTYNLPQYIKYYKNSKPLGSPENWNESIRKASGDYVKIMHHDDWFTDNNSLEKFVHAAVQHPHINFIFSDSVVIIKGFPDRTTIFTLQDNLLLKRNPISILVKNYIGAPTATLFKRELNMFFNRQLKWLVDVEFYYRVLKETAILNIPQPLVTTFAAEGRVTDLCKDNKEIEVFEFFFIFDEAIKNNSNFAFRKLKPLFFHAFWLCRHYHLTSAQSIEQCHFYGNIHWLVKAYLGIKRYSDNMAFLFEKILFYII